MRNMPVQNFSVRHENYADDDDDDLKCHEASTHMDHFRLSDEKTINNKPV